MCCIVLCYVSRAVVPWLELMDLSKWRALASAASPDSGGRRSNDTSDTSDSASQDDSGDSDIDSGGNEDEDSSRDTDALARAAIAPIGHENDDDHNDEQNFSLVLYRRGGRFDVLPISPRAVLATKALSVRSGLSQLDPSAVSQALLRAAAEHDFLLDRAGLEAFLRRVAPGRRTGTGAGAGSGHGGRDTDSSSQAAVAAMAGFSALFTALDRTSRGVVDALELAVALTVLTRGSKSAKLAAAWDVLDEDKTGMLTRRRLWRLVRSFICALAALGGEGGEGRDVGSICRMADGAAQFAVDSIFASRPAASSSAASGTTTVDFDQLADWYSSAGYATAPWLELLDMDKWTQLVRG
jgi:hypothetical protein